MRAGSSIKPFLSQIGRIGRSTSIDIRFFDTHAFEPVVWCRNNAIFRVLYVSKQEAGSESRAILYESTVHAILYFSKCLG